MACQEPKELLDTSGNLDWLFEEHSGAVIEDKADNLIVYDPKKHSKQFEKNVQLR
jgi:hypothetical protein